ncbi:MAG: hypothetical protein ACKVS8_11745 [Phycisphaerales bacterium]
MLFCQTTKSACDRTGGIANFSKDARHALRARGQRLAARGYL